MLAPAFMLADYPVTGGHIFLLPTSTTGGSSTVPCTPSTMATRFPGGVALDQQRLECNTSMERLLNMWNVLLNSHIGINEESVRFYLTSVKLMLEEYLNRFSWLIEEAGKKPFDPCAKAYLSQEECALCLVPSTDGSGFQLPEVPFEFGGTTFFCHPPELSSFYTEFSARQSVQRAATPSIPDCCVESQHFEMTCQPTAVPPTQLPGPTHVTAPEKQYIPNPNIVYISNPVCPTGALPAPVYFTPKPGVSQPAMLYQ